MPSISKAKADALFVPSKNLILSILRAKSWIHYFFQKHLKKNEKTLLFCLQNVFKRFGISSNFQKWKLIGSCVWILTLDVVWTDCWACISNVKRNIFLSLKFFKNDVFQLYKKIHARAYAPRWCHFFFAKSTISVFTGTKN